MQVLGGWFSSVIHELPNFWLLNSNISKRLLVVGMITFSRIIWRHCEVSKAPDLKDWVNALVETAFYESMLSRLRSGLEDESRFWIIYWTWVFFKRDSCSFTVNWGSIFIMWYLSFFPYTIVIMSTLVSLKWWKKLLTISLKSLTNS